MSTDDRLRTHPKDRLAAPVQRVDLAEAAAQLRAEAHPSIAGHRQVVLVRHGPVSIILFAFDNGGQLKEHRVDGEVTIHILNGRVEVAVATEVVRLAPGQLISLAPGQVHSVRALDDSEMLLTVCRVPGEQHAD